MVDCGGSLGREAASVAANLVKKCVEVVYLATCAVKPIPNPPACDHPEEIAQAIMDRTWVKLVMGTH
jgi:predicted metal-binding protein